MTPCTQKKRIENLEIRLIEVNDITLRIESAAKRIETAILGDEQLGIDGIASKVKKQGNVIDIHTRLLWIGSGIVLVLSGIWVVFAEFHN